MQSLINLIALIVYADTSSGLAIAERYAELSADIILHGGKNYSAIDRLIKDIESIGSKVISIPAHYKNRDALSRLFLELNMLGKTPNIIVINDEEKAFDLNMLRYAADQTSDHGRVIHIARIIEQADLEKMIEWIEQLAYENASRGTTVNAVFIPNADFPLETQLDDVADAAEYFAAHPANLITGQYVILSLPFNDDQPLNS